jgi:hypothetical protein
MMGREVVAVVGVGPGGDWPENSWSRRAASWERTVDDSRILSTSDFRASDSLCCIFSVTQKGMNGMLAN